MAIESSPGSSVDLPASKAGGTPSNGNPPAKKPAGKPAAGSPSAEPKQAAGKKTLVAKELTGKEGVTRQTTAKGAAKEKPAAGKQQTTAAKQPSSTREELEELERVGALGMMTLLPAWMISAIVHMVILLIFGIMVMPEPKKEELKTLVANVGENVDVVDNVPEIAPELETEVTDLASTVDVASSAADALTPSEIDDSPAPAAEIAMSDIGLPTAPAGDLLKDLTAGSGGTGKGALSGRAGNEGSKKASGATDASEAAVARALQWLSEHQYPDGSWSFEHNGGRCQGRCPDNGKLKDARFAATGMALLPFLGAGQTHKQGKYKEQVRGGLYWLISNMAVTPNGGDMTGGGGAMYGHGIASIALCEAYAMTEDRQLAAPAQAALNFIMYAQDPVGGGWRYSPRTAGDTSVVGWQIMALKSGYLGKLHVNPPVVTGAKKFLDFVQSDGGAFYGYDRPPAGAPGPATTAVGLLCRMYMGWEHEKPKLEKGVKYLASMGPKLDNMYFSYYATQVLHQYDGPDGDLWQAWNTKMRDSLIASQAMQKHETGSWVFERDTGFEPGGRLYCTSMAAMTLEIYYRYMPIYTKKSAEDDFAD